MRIGYVHVGAAEHGVTRYGRLLAAEARTRPELEVLECEVHLTGDRRADCRRVANAGRQLAAADVVHVQYNNQLSGCIWGAGWRQLLHLALFTRLARVPFVVTAHDIYRRQDPGWRWTARHPVREARRAVRAAPRMATLRWVQRRASRLFVCTHEERARIAGGDHRVSVIPHFVERRDRALSRDAAKRALGLGGARVITLLGYIHERKGHRLLVEALAQLPADVIAIFAGDFTPQNRRFVEELHRLAAARGVQDRVRITGYVPDSTQEIYLAATDLAVCPFTTVSASSSLSTWISAGRPILASDLPQIAEYRAWEPGAIRTFSPYTVQALVEGIVASLDSPCESALRAVGRLRDRLLIPAMLDRHIEEYRAVLARVDRVPGEASRSGSGRVTRAATDEYAPLPIDEYDALSDCSRARRGQVAGERLASND